MTAVLHISESFETGVATAISAYVAATPELTHTVAAGPGDGAYPVGDTPGRAFIELDASPLRQFQSLPGLIRRCRPDLVHLHSSIAGFCGRLRSGPYAVPVVYSPHCFAFERRDVRAPVRMLFRLVERTLSHRTTAFVCPSHHEAELASSLGSTSPAFVVPHAVTRPTVEEVALSSHRPRVGTCGRLAAQKGVDFFLTFVAELRERVDVEVVWIGDGQADLAATLRREDVVVTGWLSHSDVASMLATLRLYVHTAAWEVGLPYSLLEAAALEVPVVARSLAAYAGEPLSTEATPSALASTAAQVLTEPTAWQAEAARSRQLADHHSTKRQRQALLHAYESALEALR